MVTKIPPAKDSGYERNHRKTNKFYAMTVSGHGEYAKKAEENTLAQNSLTYEAIQCEGDIIPR
jgi:hypothetical protein